MSAQASSAEYVQSCINGQEKGNIKVDKVDGMHKMEEKNEVHKVHKVDEVHRAHGVDVANKVGMDDQLMLSNSSCHVSWRGRNQERQWLT